MSGHTRLYRRNATYYHRAAIPTDIKDTYPKTEETFSLGTKDYKEALRLVKLAAVDVDNRFAEHREEQRQANLPKHAELTVEQIRQVGQVYYTHLLNEDEEGRIEGFGDVPKKHYIVSSGQGPSEFIKKHGFPKSSFDEFEQDNKELLVSLKHEHARGIVDTFLEDEVDEVLSWSNINLPLLPDSPSRKLVVRELQRASIQARKAIAERNQGELVDTPDMHLVAPASAPTQTQELLSDAVEEWAGEKARTSWKGKTEKEHRTWMSNFISVAGDKQLTAYTKADARAYKAMLLKLPANWVKQKEIAGLGIAEAAEKASKLGLKPMSDLNVNKIIGFVAAFWNWAEANYDEAPSNLFKG